MAFYGDPDELDRLAVRVSASAEDARAHAHALSWRCMAVDWESTAADRFRGTIEGEVAALRRAADELDEAAHMLRRHAESVRERSAQIRAAEDAVTGWFGDQARHLARAAVGAVSRTTHDPPWTHWPWTPHNLPPPGDKQWLEVGEFLRRQGVLW
ncbi:MAG: WXG100 family type VII secretion target [Egibacteraceae bacterium]